MALESPASVNDLHHQNDELAQAVKARRSPWTTPMFRGRMCVETGNCEVGGGPKGVVAAKPSEGKVLRTIDVTFSRNARLVQLTHSDLVLKGQTPHTHLQRKHLIKPQSTDP